MHVCNVFGSIRSLVVNFYRCNARSALFVFTLFSIFFNVFNLGDAAYGQATVGSIVGTVSDSTGAGVPHVDVSVTNEATNAVRVAPTNAQGYYSASNLEPGTYRVTANPPGFKQVDRPDIVVAAQVTIRIDMPLVIGDNNTVVTVSAGAPVINSDTPTIATTVTDKDLLDNSVNLLSVAGATGDSGVFQMINLMASGYQSSGARWSMSGSRGSEAYFNVDGISSNSAGYGNYMGDAQPSFSSIQEVHYNMVQNKAEFPQLVTVTTITKSGSNKFHGSAFAYNSNNSLNALSYFSTAASVHNVQNEFGGTASGPILHDKLFFLATYEGVRQNTPAVLNASVPSLNFRSGNFSSLGTKIKNPYTGQTFAGNVIPQGLLSESALAWQKFAYPLPNYGSVNSISGNFRGSYPQINRNDQFDVRGDYNTSSTNSMYIRYSYNRSQPQYLEGGLPPSILGYEFYLKTAHQGVLSDTWVISPLLLNVAKVGFTRATIVHYGSTSGQSVIDDLGIQGVPVAPATAWGIPAISISGFTTPSEIANNRTPDQTIQFTDQMTWQKGQHTLKWGLEYRPQYFSTQNNPSFGSYSFNGQFSGPGSGTSYADFLLGLPSSTSYSYIRASEYAHFYFASGFVQDDFNVSRRLTLSYGIRYDYDSPPVDKNDAVANFNPKTGAIVVPSMAVFDKYVNPLFPSQIPVQTAAEAGFPSRSLRGRWGKSFGPRFGFAFRPFADTRTVIRGGYGLFNDDLTADMFLPLYGGPFGLTVGYTGQIKNFVPNITLTNPFLTSGGTTGAVNITGIDRNLRNPYVQQWSLTVERDLGWQTGLRLSYVGTKATQLIYERDLNQVPASTKPFSQANTPYPLYQHTYMFANGAMQSYNALTAEVDHNFRHGLSFRSAWTWAKSLTNADETGDVEGGPLIEDAYDLHRDYGNSEYSPRNRLVSNGIYELPFGRGKLFLHDNAWADRIFGGFQLSASYIVQSGLYLTPGFSGHTISNTNQTSGRPNQVSNPHLANASIKKWFDSKAFVLPQIGTYGNASKGAIEGPGIQVFNLAAFKSVTVFRENQLRLQVSATNVLNHPNFGQPDTNISDAGVGTITTTQTASFSGPRAVLLGARYTF